MSRTCSPNRSTINASDLGPWICTGATSISAMETLQTQSLVHPAQPQFEVAVGEREPELVLGGAEQHRIVQHAAVLVAQDHVLGVHGLDERCAAGDDVVDEGFRVGALYLDLSFHGDVPQRDVVDQRVVFHHRAAVFRTHVAAGVVDAVVDGGPPASRFHGQVPERRLAHTGRDEQADRRRAGLSQVDGHVSVGLVDGHALPRVRVLTLVAFACHRIVLSTRLPSRSRTVSRCAELAPEEPFLAAA